MPTLNSPVDNQPWPAERYYPDAATWTESGVIVSSVPAAYSAGDFALSFAVAGSVITVQIATGRARVQGMHIQRTETPWTSGMPGDRPHVGSDPYPLNTASVPRIDRLVLRRDLAANMGYPYILIGTPAQNPVRPALTQTSAGVYDMPMFSWQLAPNSSTAISNIVDERPWLPWNGKRLPRERITNAAAFTVGANWTLNSAFARDVGTGLATMYVSVTRTGSTISVDATGNAPETNVGQIAAGFEPLEPVAAVSAAAGRVVHGALSANGSLTLSAATGPNAIAVGEVVSLSVPLYALASW